MDCGRVGFTVRASSGSVVMVIALIVLCPSSGRHHQVLASDKRYQEDDRFPGWKGELADLHNLPGKEGAASSGSNGGEGAVRRSGAAKDWGYGSLGKESWRGEVELLSWAPRSFVYRALLSGAECDALQELARASDMSYPFKLDDNDDKIVTLVNSRISEVAFTRRGSMQDLMLFNVANGDGATAEGPEDNHELLATILIKISSPGGNGGEVVFPAGEKQEGADADAGASACAAAHPHVSMGQGDAVLIYNTHVDNTPDPTAKYLVCRAEGGDTLWAMQRIMKWPAKLGHTNPTG